MEELGTVSYINCVVTPIPLDKLKYTFTAVDNILLKFLQHFNTKSLPSAHSTTGISTAMQNWKNINLISIPVHWICVVMIIFRL